jgi:TorA maturation chaperone TorD
MERENRQSTDLPVAESDDSTYEFLGRLLLSPMDEKLCALVIEEGFWSALAEEENSESSLFRACRQMEDVTASLRSLSVEEARKQLAFEYTRLFVGPENQLVPPWESLYQGDRQHLFGKPVQDVRRFIRDNGLTSIKLGSWPEDHLGVELLILQQLTGAGQIEEDRVGQIATFIEEHPLKLVRAMNNVARSIDFDGSGFYRALLELVEALLNADLVMIRQSR